MTGFLDNLSNREKTSTRISLSNTSRKLLNRFSRNYYLQYGEDGIITKIPQRLKKLNSFPLYVTEIGKRYGGYCSNTRIHILKRAFVLLVEAYKTLHDMSTDLYGRNERVVNVKKCVCSTLGYSNSFEEITSNSNSPILTQFQ